MFNTKAGLLVEKIKTRSKIQAEDFRSFTRNARSFMASKFHYTGRNDAANDCYDSINYIKDNIANHERQEEDDSVPGEGEETSPLLEDESSVMDQQTQTSSDPDDPDAPASPVPDKPDPDQPVKSGAGSGSGPRNRAGKYAAGFGIAATILGGVAFVAANVIVPGLGFAAGGVVAGSTAAGMMSSAAIAGGGGVAAGSTVAILQSIGATGVAVSTCLGVGAGAAAVGTAVAGAVDAGIGITRHVQKKINENPCDKHTQTD